MATFPITEDNFQENIIKDKNKIIVVDFWADWCGPCKMLAPVLEKVSESQQENVVIYKLNTDENASIAQQYQITSIPCCIVFKKGEEVHRIVGHKTEDSFVAELKPFYKK